MHWSKEMSGHGHQIPASLQLTFFSPNVDAVLAFARALKARLGNGT